MLKNKEMLQNLEDRFTSAFLANSRFFNQLLEVTRYAVPSADGLNVLYQYDDGGKHLDYYVHNNTTQIASDQRASQFHSLLLPTGRKWIEIYDDNGYNEKLSEQVYNIFQKSNISSVAHSMFTDLVVGCAGVWLDSYSEKEPLVFKNITGVAILPEYSDDNTQENVWFRRIVSDRQLKQMGRTVNTAEENKNYITSGFILNRDKNDNPIYKVKNADKFKWLYVSVLNDEWDNPVILEARRFKQLHVINDTIRAGESRGRGIAMKMLNDILYLNSISKDLKDAIKMKSSPPLLANPKIGNLDFGKLTGAVLPSGLAQDGIPLLQPLQWDIDINAIRMQEEILENRIKEGFNVSPYGNVEDTPVRTATEVQARESTYQRQSTTDISRLVYDLDNMFKTCLELLQARGIVKSNTKLTFKNPLTLSENANDIQKLVTYRQVMNQVVDPQVSVIFNNPQAVDEYVKEKLLIPSSLNSTAQEKEHMNQKIQEAIQQQQAAPTAQPQAIQPAQTGLSSDVRQRGFGV